MKPEGRIVFVRIPKGSQLTYFSALIDFTEDQNVFSEYNWQKAKTRFLIQNEKDIIAAPIDRKLSYIHLITSKSHKDLKLVRLMKENNVTLLGPYLLKEDVYLKSIFHTLKVKISSEWVELDKFLVKACFLNSRKIFEGVQLRLSLIDGCLSVFTKALRLKLPLVTLLDLEVDTETLYNNGFADVQKKVFILPSFRQATAISVYLNIPHSSPFQDYESMRSHWRNLYGYILPPTSEGMFYLEVNFDRSNVTYLYPMTCVCSYEPILLKCSNESEIITEFLDALRKSFGSVCGYPISISQSNQPMVKFQLASEIQDFETPLLSHFVSSITPPSPILTQKQEEPFKCFPIFNLIKKVPCNFIRSPELTNSNGNKQTAVTISMENPPKLSAESKKELKESVRMKDLKKFKLSFLIKFCREHKIPVKAKDRKELVIQKIYSFFLTSSPNQ